MNHKNFSRYPCALQHFLNHMEPNQREQFCSEFFNSLLITKNVVVKYIQAIYKRIPRIFKLSEIELNILLEFSNTNEIIDKITYKLNNTNSHKFNMAFIYIFNNHNI